MYQIGKLAMVIDESVDALKFLEDFDDREVPNTAVAGSIISD